MSVTLPGLLARWRRLAAGCFLAPLLATAAPSRPFLQRVAVTDFLLLETNNDLALSPASSLVLCFAQPHHPGVVARAVALRPQPAGRWVLSYHTAQPAGSPVRFPDEEIPLAPEIALNVLAVFRHLLRQYSLNENGPLHAPSEDDDAWIFLREPGEGLSATALNRTLQGDTGEDTTAYRDLCAGLVGAFAGPETERNSILTQLDRFAAAYVARNRLSRR